MMTMTMTLRFEVSSHMPDEPRRGETHETHRVNGRDWTNKKDEPDGTSPEYIDLVVDHDREDNSDDKEEIGAQDSKHGHAQVVDGSRKDEC